MKTGFRIRHHLPILFVVALALAGRVMAETLTTLHNFTITIGPFPKPYTNSDGAWPYGSLVLSGNTLYGTAFFGGDSGRGTVFKVNVDGAGFTTLHSFTFCDVLGTNADGSSPTTGLVVSGNTLFGTTVWGGSSGNGTVFKVNNDGTEFTTLHNFTETSASGVNGDGAFPQAGLTLSGTVLFGSATGGGNSGNGSVFKINTDGTAFTTLYNFTPVSSPWFTNADGGYPSGTLVLLADTLFGTTQNAGSAGSGTVFAVTTNGTGFKTLHSFEANTSSNNDGVSPQTGLILSGGKLHGMASTGGNSGWGTVFALNTDGTGFTVLHHFAGYPSDGYASRGALVSSGNTLYGTASAGGGSDSGIVFKVNTDGTGFTTLHSFSASSYDSAADVATNSDGVNPQGLILSGNTLYGTTQDGGSSGNGTIFSISFLPKLQLSQFGTNLILSWPTNYAGFDYTSYTLQSATNLASPFWGTNLPAPVIINGQCTVANPISGTQQFFRLSQ